MPDLFPILFRTYCDPKSFAWQKEFLSFVGFTKKDSLDLNIVSLTVSGYK
jgi:hypothetical protein